MAGLQWPISSGHKTTQGFDGNNPFEPAGYLRSDAIGPHHARKTKFSNAVAHAHLHMAIDVSCPIGTPVIAPEAGRIIEASTYASTGEHFMMLQVKPGTILFFTHLSKFVAAKGSHVGRGETIALSGNSGMSTGPHLHWEVRINANTAANPLLSSAWFKFNPQRLRVGGDLATMPQIAPPGGVAAPSVAPVPAPVAGTDGGPGPAAPAGQSTVPAAAGATAATTGEADADPAVSEGSSPSAVSPSDGGSDGDRPPKLVDRTGRKVEF